MQRNLKSVRFLQRIFAIVVVSGFFAALFPMVAQAITSSSNNYQITEQQFSAGSNLDSCSTQFCAQVTIGDPSSSRSSSSASFKSGPTSDEPVISVIVDAGSSNLGNLTTESTATKTAVVRISTYLSGGYILQIVGDPPKFAGHTLSASSTPTSSTAGVEQFGINLVANTSPSVGADPAQVPTGTIFGVANNNYKTTNLFMYSSGDTVAHSLLDSGRTDYTISMIVNIASSTPAGHYTGDFTALVMPAY